MADVTNPRTTARVEASDGQSGVIRSWASGFSRIYHQFVVRNPDEFLELVSREVREEVNGEDFLSINTAFRKVKLLTGELVTVLFL